MNPLSADPTRSLSSSPATPAQPDPRSTLEDWDWQQFLSALGRFGVDLSLERMVELLERLGHPQRGIPVIHVAGTNGKGSVCALVSQVLRAAGYRVGRYISPHLIDWRERIWVNGEWIPSADWSALLFELQQHLKQYPESLPYPTQFEVVTAATWLYFRQQQVDLAVMEVGLGGRLDATNAAIDAAVTVITCIGWDHWQRLGHSLSAIAREKAGIIKPGVPLICGPQVMEVLEVIQETSQQLSAPLQGVRLARRVEVDQIEWEGKRFPLPLQGEIQLINGAIALQTIQALRDQGWQISDLSIREGFAQTRWPGRLHSIQIEGRQVLVDGAHNQPAALALREYLDRLGSGSITWFMGILETKDIKGICRTLLRPGDRLYTLPVADHVGINPDHLLEIALQIEPELSHGESVEDLKSWQRLLAQEDLGERLVLCGSLYLIGQVMETCLGWEIAT